MLHEHGQVLSSFSFPNNPQFPIPGHALPAPKLFMGAAVSNRGRPSTGSATTHRNRGKPFFIEWYEDYGAPIATFGDTGSFLLDWMDFPTFQKIINSPNPLRLCSTILWQRTKGHG